MADGPVGALGGGLGFRGGGTNAGALGLNFGLSDWSSCDGVGDEELLKCELSGLKKCFGPVGGAWEFTGLGAGGGVLDTIAGDFTTGMKAEALGLSFLGVADGGRSLVVGTGVDESLRGSVVEVESFDFGDGGLPFGNPAPVLGIEGSKFRLGGEFAGTTL